MKTSHTPRLKKIEGVSVKDNKEKKKQMPKIRVKFRKGRKRWATCVVRATCNNEKDPHYGMEMAIVELGEDALRPGSGMTYQFAFNTKTKGWVSEQSSGGRLWGSQGLIRYWKKLTWQDLPEKLPTEDY